MRHLVLLFSLLAFTAYAQKNQTVNLRWKIAPGDTLRYTTVIQDLDSSSFRMRPPMPGVDSSYLPAFDKARRSRDNYNYVSKLWNAGNDVINVLLVATPKDSVNGNTNPDGDLRQAMQSMSRGVMLRGSVYASGGIHSFWLNNRQRNLLAMLFELPSKPVKVGDKWSLEVHLIGNDQNFTCDSSFRKNEVTFTGIEVSKGDSVAVLHYDIEEFVRGSFGGLHAKNPQATMMHTTYQVDAKFSMRQGRWIAYEGLMGYDATGIMLAHQRTKYSLVKQ